MVWAGESGVWHTNLARRPPPRRVDAASQVCGDWLLLVKIQKNRKEIGKVGK